jgi:hypothetical protein
MQAEKIHETLDLENWSGGVMNTFLGSNFTKNQLFCPFCPLIK